MATPVSHAVAALSIGTCFNGREVTKGVWLAAVLCSIVPDLDVIGFRFGVHYGDFWGHRGFTHSLLFAALLAGLVTFIFRRTTGVARVLLFVYFFAATASHGLLDAMTNGGLGVAFFSPFDTHRYFLPWRPIQVSPITISKFLSQREIAVMRTEVLWVWLPSAVFAFVVLLVRWGQAARVRNRSEVTGAGNRT